MAKIVGMSTGLKVWTFWLRYPSSGNPNGFPQTWFAGVTHEAAHTSSCSGHHLAIEGTGVPHFRYMIWRPPLQSGCGAANYDVFHDPEPIELDRWYQFKVEVRYSTGSDGFVRYTRDGVVRAEKLGFPSIEPNYGGLAPQVGYYSAKTGVGLNEAQFADLRLAQSP